MKPTCSTDLNYASQMNKSIEHHTYLRKPGGSLLSSLHQPFHLGPEGIQESLNSLTKVAMGDGFLLYFFLAD